MDLEYAGYMVGEKKMLNGFQSKYSTLPKLPNLSNTALIPYKGKDSTNSSSESMERINNLETRLNIIEKSNRALLDEIVRLHNQFRTTSKQYEDAFKEEKRIRSFLESNYQTSQDQVKDLEYRLETIENLLNQEHGNIRDLLYKSKNIEENIVSSKKDTSVLNDRQLSKLVQLEREVETMNANGRKIEQVSHQLVDEMKMIKSKLEAQGFDFNIITHELRNKSKKLESEYQQNIDVVKKQLSRNENINDAIFRPMIDQKLVELNKYISQIRTWHDEEVNERRHLEKSIMTKFSEVALAMNEQSRLREEAIREIQYAQREKDHKIEAEKMVLQTKIGELSENVNSKVNEKDLRLRDEQLKHQSELEMILKTEQDARVFYQQEIRAENERRFETMRQLQSDELKSIKEAMKYDKIKLVESVKRLDEALNIIERQIEENKNEAKKYVAIESRTRNSQEKAFKNRLTEIDEKLTNATSKLQFVISGISDKSQPNNEKIQNMINDILKDYKAATNRQIADLDTRILNYNSHSSNDPIDIDEKINQSVSSLNKKLSEKIETIYLTQGTTDASINQLKLQKQQLKQELYELKEFVILTKSECNVKINTEMNYRIKAEEELHIELGSLREGIPKDIISRHDLNKVKTTARKLAESMQTIKTVLGMKIQSEQNLRIEEIKQHQQELIQLKTLIEPIVYNMNHSARQQNDHDKDSDNDINSDNDGRSVPHKNKKISKDKKPKK